MAMAYRFEMCRAFEPTSAAMVRDMQVGLALLASAQTHPLDKLVSVAELARLAGN